MKKSLIVILSLSLVLVLAATAFALDKDKDSIKVKSNFKDVVWVTLTKNSDLAPITRGDVRNGYKEWKNFANMQIDAATQYMAAIDVVALRVPENYKACDLDGAGAPQSKDRKEPWLDGAYGGDPKLSFEHRLVFQSRKKNITRDLKDSVFDTCTLDYHGSPGGFTGFYGNGGNWTINKAGLPTSPSGRTEFINDEWDNGNGPLAGVGYVGIDGNTPIVAAGPSTNSIASGDNFKLDLGLQMIEGDNIASGKYRVKVVAVVMELVPSATGNTPADIQAVIK